MGCVSGITKSALAGVLFHSCEPWTNLHTTISSASGRVRCYSPDLVPEVLGQLFAELLESCLAWAPSGGLPKILRLALWTTRINQKGEGFRSLADRDRRAPYAITQPGHRMVVPVLRPAQLPSKGLLTFFFRCWLLRRIVGEQGTSSIPASLLRVLARWRGLRDTNCATASGVTQV